MVRTLFLATLAVVLLPLSAAQAQTGALRGTVHDSGTQDPLFAANVLVTSRQDPQSRIVRLTDEMGAFAVEDLPAGLYEVRVSHISYATQVEDEVDIRAGETVTLSLALTEEPIPMETVIVSASRRQEKVLDAPAAVQVVDGERIRETSALTPADHLLALPSVDVARAGLNQGTVVVRGFNNVFSGQTLTLVDNRIARVPSLRYNAMNFIPTLNEDIERIEVVSGPGSALYGPNAANGVVHMITRSPFNALGTQFSVSGGERDLLMGSVLHAGVPSETVGYKIGVSYYQGTDFEYDDPVEQGARAQAIANGANPTNLRIGARDFDIEKISVDGRIDLAPRRDLSVVIQGGWNEMNAIELTGLGAVQAKDFGYFYGQTRVSFRDFFFQTYVNRSDAGSTYNLRTGDLFRDQSMFIVSQIQHQAHPTESQTFTYGVDLLLTRPDTKGTINGRNEEDDDINEFGVYLQSETMLNDQWTFTAAARGDDNNRLAAVFSPRAALVFEPASGHKLRTTYNRAFSTPTPNNYFLDLVVLDDLGGFSAATGGLADGYDLLTKGVPKGGFTFRRDSMGGIGGLYMQVPQALGGTGSYLPADATLMWPAVVNILGAQGQDISGIPAPTAASVNTQLAVLNPTTASFEAVTPDYVQDVGEMEPTINNTFEFGYKGVLGNKFSAQADVWHSRIKDFVGPLRVETPTVFLDAASLAQYLSNPAFGLSSAQVQGLTAAIAQIPLGTVTPEDAEDPADPFLTYRNFGNVDLTGFDLALSWYVDRFWTAGINYSFVNKDFFADASGVSDIALNAPQHKGGIHLGYHNREEGIQAGTRVRLVDSFPVLSGVYVGDVDAYAVVDLNASWTFAKNPGTTLSLNVLNALDSKHKEFVGVPELRRVATVRLTQRI